jgi:hypothetical protein
LVAILSNATKSERGTLPGRKIWDHEKFGKLRAHDYANVTQKKVRVPFSCPEPTSVS